MGRQRTTAYVDVEDLAVLKEAAAREGVTEAEIIRAAVHLAALSKQSKHPQAATSGATLDR